jgi:hypothetical protein
MRSPRDLVRKRADAGAGDRDPSRFVRALIGDLVDKNLWPVALLLCVAIVAIPVLLTRGSGGDGAAPVPAVTPQPDGTANDAVELIGPPTAKTRTGSQIDPFRQPKKKPKASAAAGTIAVGGSTPAASPSADTPSAATPSGGTPSAGSPSAGSPSAGTPSAGSPSATTKPMVNPATVYYRTEVRWSEAEGSRARAISRLTPLGGVGERGALYLGVSNLGYAMFLLSPTAKVEVSPDAPAAESACADATTCRVVALKGGSTQVVIVPQSDGSKARRYHLEAVSVKRVVTSVAAAGRMRAKEHSEGRAVLREMLSDALTAQVLDLLRYDEASGQLVLTSGAKKTTK